MRLGISTKLLIVLLVTAVGPLLVIGWVGSSSV